VTGCPKHKTKKKAVKPKKNHKAKKKK
jgi:hypothetical protein